MRRLLQSMAPVFHLTRVTTAFAIIANTWFVILWSRAEREFENPTGRLATAPLWILLAAGAGVALGLFSFGTSLNDILDLKRDRTLRPDRPLASGQLPIDLALALVVGTMVTAIVGATVFGTEAVLLTLALIGAIFVFNATGRFIPAIGLVLLGLIHAGHMLIPNLELKFLWPIWLAMTHSLLVAAISHRIAHKVPRISRRAMAAAVIGWAFWSMVLIWLQFSRQGSPRTLWPAWINPWAAAWPAGLVVVFAIVAWAKVKRYGRNPRSAEKISRYGSLWLALYACAWLVGAQRTYEAWILILLTMAGFLGMTVLRELYGLVEQPMGYRR